MYNTIKTANNKGAGQTARICTFVFRVSLNQVLFQILPIFEPCHEKCFLQICENKGADQLRCNRAADQCLYFSLLR